MFALFISLAGAGFSWWSWFDSRSYLEKRTRPYLNVTLKMLQSEIKNGVQLSNEGVGTAVIKNVSVINDEKSFEHKTALRDLKLFGWPKGSIVRMSFQEGQAIKSSGDAWIYRIDRNIGETDITILDRLFNHLEVQVCYCDVTDTNCWKYKWIYQNRDGGHRKEERDNHCTN